MKEKERGKVEKWGGKEVETILGICSIQFNVYYTSFLLSSYPVPLILCYL